MEQRQAEEQFLRLQRQQQQLLQQQQRQRQQPQYVVGLEGDAGLVSGDDDDDGDIDINDDGVVDVVASSSDRSPAISSTLGQEEEGRLLGTGINLVLLPFRRHDRIQLDKIGPANKEAPKKGKRLR